ncbi:hypothetical protein GCM10007874_19320 [Labrys miyagiensis]|uniref:Methyltransferase type 11 domain-containing protein n=2 Tax=Labrys miyagiensis TaxID=346912 RepID=A0ABQ6CG73_9HYPH|nr:hypothetical protein GCM10007874_19320 [Labrys miyagiensis]
MGLWGLARQLIGAGSRMPVLGSLVIGSYQARLPKTGWNLEHPFDRLHGVDTSGTVPDYMLIAGATAYGAAQPSIVCRALAAIPEPRSCHFVDLGCGKGRPLLVASGIFPTLTGVEISRALAQVARANAAAFGKAHPQHGRIDIIAGDALAYALPDQPLVIFLYNPFRFPLMARLVETVEASLRRRPRDLYIVYYNPVCAELFDASRLLERRYAAQLPYDAGEIGYGPEESDAVVIWQNRGNTHPLPVGSPNTPITIVSPDARAVVEAVA